MLRMIQLACCSRTGLLYQLTGIFENFVDNSVKEAVVCVSVCAETKIPGFFL